MSEPFVVPESSVSAADAATRGYSGAVSHGTNQNVAIRAALREAYAVDLPRIVRAEVERLLADMDAAAKDWPLSPKKPGWAMSVREWIQVWLANRFPEPPEGGATITTDYRPEFPPGIADVARLHDIPARPAPSAETARCPATTVGGQCRLPEGHTGAHADRDGTWETATPCPHGNVGGCAWCATPSCTACPCARHTAMEEFVRALAKEFGERGSIGTVNGFNVHAHNFGPVAAAAWRVTEGR